jgi:hypothetical protein
MRNYTIALVVAITSVVAILVSSFVDTGSIKNLSIAKAQEDQVAGEQHTAAKMDSFSAGKIFSQPQGNLNNIDATVVRGKNYLLTQVSNRLRQLNPIRAKVSDMTALGESERATLVAELNAEISAFEAFKAEINKSTTHQDIVNVADQIKAEWIKSRRSVESAEKQILAVNEEQLISNADTATLGMQKRIETLKAAGKNTKAHEKLLVAYGQKIAYAKQDVESAKEKFEAVASAPSEDEKVKLMQTKDLLLKSAQGNVKEAYKLLAEGARQDFSSRFK